METRLNAELLAHYNLDEEKIRKMIDRAIQACLAYRKGKMSLKQVWYRARGDRFDMACQLWPDREVGSRLWILANDFYTDLGVNDSLIERSIFQVVEAVQGDGTQPRH